MTATGQPARSVDDVLAMIRALPPAYATRFAVPLHAPKRVFDAALAAAWAAVGSILPVREVGEGDDMASTLARTATMPSSIDSANRETDARRVLGRLGLPHPERGSATAPIRIDGALVAVGYLRILYGDHGPYFELIDRNVQWERCPLHLLKGPDRHYHDHYAVTGRGNRLVKLYRQFRTVADEPDPPSGPFSVANHRPEGYAPYRPGAIYLSADEVTEVGRSLDGADSSRDGA